MHNSNLFWNCAFFISEMNLNKKQPIIKKVIMEIIVRK